MQPYPDAANMAEAQQPSAPGSVLNAVKVMYAGAAVSVINAVIYLVTQNSTKTAIAKKHPHLSASTLNTVTHVGVIIGAIVGLIGAALFIWIARSSRSGKNWARVTGTVFFAITVLGTVYNLVSGEAMVIGAMSFIVMAIGLAAVVLLWQASSNSYFSFFKRPQF